MYIKVWFIFVFIKMIIPKELALKGVVVVVVVVGVVRTVNNLNLYNTINHISLICYLEGLWGKVGEEKLS